ncbi:MAG: ABC transporter ATP-binding protein [Candidatus Odinarchaeota archaeon]
MFGLNYGNALVDSIIIVLILYLISNIVNSQIPEYQQISKKLFRRSSGKICIILLGIIFGVKSLFETLWLFNSIFLAFNNNAVSFAIITTIFYFLYRKLVEKDSQFIKIFKFFIVLTWIIAIIFISIPLLGLERLQGEEPVFIDIFYLGFIWAGFIIAGDILITILINNIRSIEKRIPKIPLKYSMFTGGLISFGIWSIQLIIIELYLNRLFGVIIYTQDIRTLFGVVSGLYGLICYISLKKKFMPIEKEKSKLKIQKALEIVKDQSFKVSKLSSNHIILDVKDLTTYFYTEEGIVRAVENVSFRVYEGEVLGLVGETGCGKSVTALSIVQLIRPPGKRETGKIVFSGEDLALKSEFEILKYRGKDITMIFQDPLSSLNPVFKVGKQISEVFLLHMENELLVETTKFPNKGLYSIAREWGIALLKDLNIPFPEIIYDRYPHELSGGMRQRVQIAMALACRPKLLIADEPTTALDVTIQNQILKLMKDLRKKYNTSILYITHDLGLISKMCDRVAVMYSGSIVEYGDIKKLLINPYHPYTQGLIASVPVIGKSQKRLEVISGMVPNLIYPPSGCRFHPRCKYCFEPCNSIVPKQNKVDKDYFVACHLYNPEYKHLAEIIIEKVEGEI